MQYRKFGSTGVQISRLGFGTMRLPMVKNQDGSSYVDEDKAISIIHRSFELGVNYIDSAYGYCQGQSEIVMGKALKGWRDKVYVSTKVPTWHIKEKGDYRRLLEEQLKKTDLDYIDFYHFHSLNADNFENIVKKFDLFEDAIKAKEEGLIKHISFSFHDKPEVLKRLIDVGIFETLLCQYNLLDRSNEEAMEYAKSKGLGVLVMGPVGGGRLSSPSEILKDILRGKAISTAEMALRFVLANPNVSCALSGMNTMEMVEENAGVASIEEPLTQKELERINEILEQNRRLTDLYCTGCNYCMPCPNGVDIPLNFTLMNYYQVYGLKELAKSRYASLGAKKETKNKRAEECIECGACETKCPQNIPIPKRLRDVAETLGNI